MAESLIGPKEYIWRNISNSAVEKPKFDTMVLVKKSFTGKLKAIVQELDDFVEIVNYKIIKIKIDELSDDDLYDLIGYFTERRLSKQVELLKKEIEYRKKLLIDKDAIRPAELRNSLKIKYNITKKVYKEKKYKSKKVKLPKKDFILVYTKNRLLCEYVNQKLGISFNLVFNIINAKEYMKHLKKYEDNERYDESKLFDDIEKNLRSIIDSYLSSITYKFSDKEELLSDNELRNKINIVCLEYGIEIPSISVVLSKEEKLRQAGLSEEQIELIVAYDSTGKENIIEQKKIQEKEKIIAMIKKLQDIGVEITDDGFLTGLADQIAREYGEVDSSEFISIFKLNNNIITEICRAYTSPIKTR